MTQYLNGKFTLPAGSAKVTDIEWDSIFLSDEPEKFHKKYSITIEEYKGQKPESGLHKATCRYVLAVDGDQIFFCHRETKQTCPKCGIPVCDNCLKFCCKESK